MTCYLVYLVGEENSIRNSETTCSPFFGSKIKYLIKQLHHTISGTRKPVANAAIRFF